MEVTTFYSFKGGLGRSLLLSWAARQMAADGTKIIALDFDLEAPGLAYKFGFSLEDDMGPGLVGLLRQFQLGHPPPDSLASHLRPVPGRENLWLLPAGPLEPASYWRNLAGISWESLLVDKPSNGLRFFQWLREQLESEFAPEHLFIDARTGVTEMGGVALSVLATQVLALTGTSEESVVGTREVLRSTISMPQTWGSQPPRLGLVLSRMPATMGSIELQKLREVTKDRICEVADPLTSTLELELPLVIRSEPTLQVDESQVLDGGELRVHEDYQAVLAWIRGAPVPTAPPGVMVPEDPSPKELQASIAHQRALAVAARDPEQYEPDLALSLMNLGSQLRNDGRLEEALTVYLEAVDLYRRLSSRHPGVYLPNAAAGLNNLGAMLSDLGRQGEGLEATQESVAIYRQLAEKDPSAFEAQLAASLNNYGNGLSGFGRRQEALAALSEAVAIRRRLAERQPEVFEPDLSVSLNNLGAMLARVGHKEAALEAAREAVQIRRGLVEDSPSRFKPNLARSLTNLGIRLSELENYQDARSALHESVALYREAAEAQSDSLDSELAGTLGTLSDIAWECGAREEAIQARKEAVALYEQLTSTDQARYEPPLVMSLLNLGVILKEAGLLEDALHVTEQGAQYLKKFFEEHPRPFAEVYAGSLGNLGAIQEELRPEEACRTYEEAIRILLPHLDAGNPAHIDLGTQLRDGLLRSSQAAGPPQDPGLLGVLNLVLLPSDDAADSAAGGNETER